MYQLDCENRSLKMQGTLLVSKADALPGTLIGVKLKK